MLFTSPFGPCLAKEASPQAAEQCLSLSLAERRIAGSSALTAKASRRTVRGWRASKLSRQLNEVHLRTLHASPPEQSDEPVYDGLSLDRRDPDYIREWLPLAELAFRYYFRVRVYGLEDVPHDGPLIFVGNHSGGLSTPDTAMAAHAYFSARGTAQPVYALVHPSMFKIKPLNQHLMRFGGLAATPRMARRVLEAGCSLLLYPGAGDEAFRPYTHRHKVELHGRSAYVKLALRYGAAIVPVVSLGSHETLIVLDDGRERAARLGLDKLGVERLPLTYSWPLGLTLGPHHNIPFPARIDLSFGKPIVFKDFSAATARDPRTIDFCHNHVERRMQAMLDHLLQLRGGRGESAASGRGSDR